jgi:hypothetical protein
MLASYIFESLVITQTGINRRPGDEMVSSKTLISDQVAISISIQQLLLKLRASTIATQFCTKSSRKLISLMHSYFSLNLSVLIKKKPPCSVVETWFCFQLGFEAAVAAIGLKAHVSEAEHPLLCEGTRRQRGDLALLLLVHYKDQPER